jgi:hypothetical protein
LMEYTTAITIVTTHIPINASHNRGNTKKNAGGGALLPLESERPSKVHR